MDSSPSITALLEQFAALAADLASTAPDHFSQLAAILGEPGRLFSSGALEAVLRAIRELEQAGPERLSELFASLSAWSASGVGIEEKLRPLIGSFAALLASVQLDDVGPRFDAAVMPWLERLGEACVAAIMGDK